MSSADEEMRFMHWTDELNAATEKARAAMGLHAAADVIRLSVKLVADSVLNSGEFTSYMASKTNELLGEKPIDVAHVSLLDDYSNGERPRQALTRFTKQDVSAGEVAAQACGLTFAEFARRATLHLIALEEQTPGYLARIQATYAREDLTARQVLGLTDIQPWGDENYRDYGLPD